METRKRYKGSYNENSQENPGAIQPFDVDSIKSTSNWDQEVTRYLNIEVHDKEDINMIVSSIDDLQGEAKSLLVEEWENGEWLNRVVIKDIDYNNKIKTIIGKIRDVYKATVSVPTPEMYVDGYMDSILHILGFDEYPCFMYPQYEYYATIGSTNHTVTAKSDFSVLSELRKILLVIEDKTIGNAKYSNNWKEDQVLGELFVAVHNLVSNHHNKNVEYPVVIYAVRVIGTLFTFYKTIATKDYIKETARRLPNKNKMTVYRHPPVEDDPSNLTAYDICNINDRKNILKCLCSIRKCIVT